MWHNDVDLSPDQQFILSLCSGGGGLDLGVRLAVPAARTVGYVEIEAFACATLVRQMEALQLDPAPVWTDLKTFRGRKWRGAVDGIIGGYPCQPFSVAGKQRGADDPRHLWPTIRRNLRIIRPTWCFFENVANHLQVGFDQVARDLQELDYDVAAGVFTAEEVGASHRRERLFILAMVQPSRAQWGSISSSGDHAREGTVAYGQTDGGLGESGAPLEYAESGQLRRESPAGRIDAGYSSEELADASRGGTESVQQCGQLQGSELDSAAMADTRRLPARGATDTRETQSRGLFGQPTGSSPQLEHPPQYGCRERGTEPVIRGGRDTTAVAGSLMGDTDATGLERRDQSVSIGTYQLPAWPPSPSDDAAWLAILQYAPHLAPAIESNIRRMAHGMAARVDRLRLLGNGVVPEQAAYAFWILAGDLWRHRRGYGRSLCRRAGVDIELIEWP